MLAKISVAVVAKVMASAEESEGELLAETSDALGVLGVLGLEVEMVVEEEELARCCRSCRKAARVAHTNTVVRASGPAGRWAATSDRKAAGLLLGMHWRGRAVLPAGGSRSGGGVDMRRGFSGRACHASTCWGST